MWLTYDLFHSNFKKPDYFGDISLSKKNSQKLLKEKMLIKIHLTTLNQVFGEFMFILKCMEGSDETCHGDLQA